MTDVPPLTMGTCSACGSLRAEHSAFQKHGWPEENSWLPAGTEALVLVRDLQPDSGRKLQIKRCGRCGSWFLYRTDYTFLAGGSEDEEYLSRLTPEEAAAWLAQAQR